MIRIMSFCRFPPRRLGYSTLLRSSRLTGGTRNVLPRSPERFALEPERTPNSYWISSSQKFFKIVLIGADIRHLLAYDASCCPGVTRVCGDNSNVMCRAG